MMMFVGGVVLMLDKIPVLFLPLEIYGVGVFCSCPNPYICCRLISPQNFILCQCLLVRNVCKLFSSNRAISHIYAAHCINELSRGSILGYEILTAVLVDCTVSC